MYIQNTETVNQKYRQIVATVSVAYLCISCGNVLGYTSTAIPSMKKDVLMFPELNEDSISWLGGLGPLGALLGALLTIAPLKYLGSRRTIGVFGAPSMLCSWIIIGLSKSLNFIYLGRFFGGFATGIIIPCSSLYVIDISSAAYRQRLGILPHFMMTIGILLSYILGSFFDWRSLAFSCAIIAAPSFVLVISASDSPKWWITQKNEENRAFKILEKLQGTSEAFISLNAILEKIQEENKFRERGLRLTTGALKSFAIVLGIMSFQQLTGINGVTFYSVNIFSKSGGGIVWGDHIPAIVLAGIQCCASFSSSFVIERAGRKTLLLISSSVVSSAAAILAAYFYFGVDIQDLFWVPLVALIVFVLGFGCGYGPVTWPLCAELLEEETRHILNPIAMAYNWFCIFIVTKSFPILLTEINIYGVFLLYAISGLVGTVFIASIVPESQKN